MQMFAAGIRLPGEVFGALMIIMAGVFLAAIITFITGLIKKYVFQNHAKAQKVIDILNLLIWLGAILLIILDLIGITSVLYDLLSGLFRGA